MIKIFFGPLMSIDHGKLLTKNLFQVFEQKKNQGMFFRAYRGWSLKHVAQNYLFIVISYYRNIAMLCLKCLV